MTNEEAQERARFLGEAKADALRVLAGSGPRTAAWHFIEKLRSYPDLKPHRRFWAMHWLDVSQGIVPRGSGAVREWIETYGWPAVPAAPDVMRGPGGWYDEDDGVPPLPGTPT